jgi:hypothetical protein
VEADVDHQGNPKPFHFLENKERFAPFLDRINYIQMTDLGTRFPVIGDKDVNWARIYAQRDEITKGLKGLRKEDIVLFGDADEILHPEGVAQALLCAGQVDGLRFYQRHAIFCVDWEEQEIPWRGPIAVRMGKLPKKFHIIRDYGYSGHTFYGAGWHLSWLGGPDAIKGKMASYCHPELDGYISDNLAARRLIEEGYYWGAHTTHGMERKLTPVQVGKEWPRWIYERRCPDDWFRGYYKT